MEQGELNALIKRITQEVLYRISQAQPVDEEVSGTVVLVSSYVPSPKSALTRIKEVYGDTDIEFINFGTDFTPVMEKAVHADETNRDEIIGKVAEAANVILITPRLSTLANIAGGDDEGFVEHLLIRSLLWGRNAGILLDFEPPRFKRNTFFEKVVTTVDTLTDMGVRVMSYRCAAGKDGSLLTLVTEQDVQDAARAGKTRLAAAAGAIVTPSAKDKARELDISIDY